MPANLPTGKTTTLPGKFFRFLDRECVVFCVLGDTTGYPETISGDVDLVVYPQDFSRMDGLMLAFCAEVGVKLVHAWRHEQTSCAYVVADTNAQEGPPDFLMFDICSDYYRNGKRLLSAVELLRDCRPSSSGEFRIPTAATGFIYYLLKKNGKQHLDDEQGNYLSHVFAEDPENAASQISRFWSGQYVTDLRDAARTNRWESIRQRLTDFQKNVRLPDQQKGFELQDIRRKVSRVLYPSGLFVAFLGPDGSGKSTVIHRVMETLCFRQTRMFHLRPRLGQKCRVSNAPVTEPHGQPPRSLLFSLLKVLYFWLDYTLGYFLKLRWLLVRSTLLVFDRYYYDLLVDPRRFRYQGPRGILQWVGQLIPKPDLVILLDAPTEVLQSRKQEVSFEETERQRQAFLEVVQCLPNGHVVDASQPVETVARETEQILLTWLEQRLKKRFGSD
jgi:thymidylate kinase